MAATQKVTSTTTEPTARRDITRAFVRITTAPTDDGIAIDADGITTGRGAGTLQGLAHAIRLSDCVIDI